MATDTTTEPETVAPPVRPARWRRVAAVTVLVIAAFVTVLAVGVVIAAFRDDAKINEDRASANAEVLSVSWMRTIVRFETADGTVVISENGVQYPPGLNEGQIVAVDYATNNPNLVRVKGRDATLSLLPAGTTIAGVWIVALPLAWFLRRKPR